MIHDLWIVLTTGCSTSARTLLEVSINGTHESRNDHSDKLSHAARISRQKSSFVNHHGFRLTIFHHSRRLGMAQANLQKRAKQGINAQRRILIPLAHIVPSDNIETSRQVLEIFEMYQRANHGQQVVTVSTSVFTTAYFTVSTRILRLSFTLTLLLELMFRKGGGIVWSSCG